MSNEGKKLSYTAFQDEIWICLAKLSAAITDLKTYNGSKTIEVCVLIV